MTASAPVQTQARASLPPSHLIYPATQKEGIIGPYGERRTDNPSDNIFEIRLEEPLNPSDKVWLKYTLEGAAHYTHIPRSINDRLARGGYLVKQSPGPSLQCEQLHPWWLKQGTNRIQFSLAQDAPYGYRISNLYIEIERNANPSPLVINTTANAYNHKAYIQGFIQDENASQAVFYIDGQPVSSERGEFEAIVPLGSQGKVTVKALYGGKEITRELFYRENIPADIEYPQIVETACVSRRMEKGESGTLQIEKATLNLQAEALLSTQDISITTLRDIDLPALNMGMSNVTGGVDGYRFLPHGQHFAQGATVSIKYDRTKIPSGYTEEDIRTYYFDLESKSWLALELDSIDRENHLVVSRTTHFTDMINGVIQVPESPQTQGFAPTMMTGIKAADPSSKVQLIAPPSANPRGTATLEYPFEMPPARNGMQPRLGIRYNSESGSGWLGEGWDLDIPSITVDTRWGVPRYSQSQETETYTMDGTMLVTMNGANPSVAHRAEKTPRTADRQFYPRREGGFSQIIRKGSKLDQYTWEVTDRSGTKYYYGRKIKNEGPYANPQNPHDSILNGVLLGEVKYLENEARQVITQWHLSRVEEIHGDYIDYYYEVEEEPVAGELTSRALYLKEIRSGNKDQDPHTVVTFTRGQYKNKQTNNGRYGFLTSSNRRLDKVTVEFEGEILRSYQFTYQQQSPFHSTLLQSVTHQDPQGREFATHTFDYHKYEKIDQGSFHGNEQKITLPDAKLNAPFLNVGTHAVHSSEPSALGGSKTTLFGASSYTGVGIPGNLTSKTNTVGFYYAYSRNITEGISALVDINGDGLPDKVFVDNNVTSNDKMYYYANQGNGKFDTQKIAIKGINTFSENTSNSNTFGGKGYLGLGGIVASAGVDYNSSNSTTSVYFADVNNDGLIDIVKDKKVYFNHIQYENGKPVPTFSRQSSLTPSPIDSRGSTIDAGAGTPDESEQETLIRFNPIHDVVRVWEAPYEGEIQVSGNVRLLAPPTGYDPAEYKKADGVRVAIQYKNESSERWSRKIAKEDTTTRHQYNLNLTVHKGDKIYFRLQPGNTSTSNGSFDRVIWAPQINYTDRQEETDLDGKSNTVYDYNPALDFFTVGPPAVLLNDQAGQFNIRWELDKRVTSDSITLRVTLSNDKEIDVEGEDDPQPNPDYKDTVIFQRTYAPLETINISRDSVFNNTLAGGKYIGFEILSPSNIALENIRWAPQVIYQKEDGHNDTITAQANYSHYGQMFGQGEPLTLQDTARISLKPAITPLLPNMEGNIRLVLKNEEGWVSHHSFTCSNGNIIPGVIDSVQVPAGTITMQYYTDNLALFNPVDSFLVNYHIWMPGDTIYNDTVPLPYDTLSIQAFAPRRDEAGLGTMYRGWGQFVYNANEKERYQKPLDEKAFTLSDKKIEVSKDPDQMNETLGQLDKPLISMSPDPQSKTYWRGPDENTWIKGDTMSASRFGQQHVIPANPLATEEISNVSGECLTGSEASGIDLKSESSGWTEQLGVSAGPASGIGNKSGGDQKNLSLFQDMNGDGYPDILTTKSIQYTNTRGGFDGEALKGDYLHGTKNESYSVGIGGSPIPSGSNTTAKGSGVKTDYQASVSSSSAKSYSFSADVASNKDETKYTLADINGDGLPDRIHGDKKVSLNLGYAFSPRIDYGIEDIQKGESTPISAGLGFGMDWAASSLSAGSGVATTFNSTNYMLIDINGDGLPDKVWKQEPPLIVYKVALNTGNGFESEPQIINIDAINKSSSTSESINAAFTFGFPVWIIRIVENIGAYGGHSVSRPTFELRDVDGDGFPDMVSSGKEDEMNVRYSRIGTTNKLKTVTNPLGGRFSIDYAHSQATYDHPGGKWVMSSVEVDDRIDDDGPNMKNRFEYENGKHDRREREFLGFGQVKTISIDTGNGHTPYRVLTEEYDVNNYYVSGNLLSTTLADTSGNKFTRREKEYYHYQVTAQANHYTFGTLDACSDQGIALTPVKAEKAYNYEGQAEGMLLSQASYSYHTASGEFADLSTYTFTDSSFAHYTTTITYQHDRQNHILGLPVQVQVKSGGELYRQVEAAYQDTRYNPGRITQVTRHLAEGKTAITQLEYDPWGNLTKKTLPANYKGEKMHFTYLYDRKYNLHVERIEDAFGYRTELEDYNYRYGMPLTVRDMNGYTQHTLIDDLGRPVSIQAPNEASTGQPYTMRFEYHLPQNTGTGWTPAYASTFHYDPQHPGDDMETITFTDGTGRPLQVKKDGVITSPDGQADQLIMLVSGRILYDAFGRPAQTFHPVTQPAGERYSFHTPFDAVAPTRTRYDVLDRETEIQLPDGSTTRMEYTRDTDNHLQVTTLTDAQDNTQKSFTSGSGLTVRTEQLSGPDGTIATRFEYDPIGQLLKAVDHGGNQTLSRYDMGGRRTSVSHPASGTTTFEYDNTGNLLKRQTANLRAENDPQGEDRYITYQYDYNRLVKINYPLHPQNNVTYTYGGKNASFNRVGRLALLEDGTGAQEFFYGRQGELTRLRRTLVIPNQAIATYETGWRYDSWNRLAEMTYPDQEKITYTYNRGGQLQSVKGEKAYSYHYVQKLGYDKFEQRIYMQYCNGAETFYRYDEQRRRLDNLEVASRKTGGTQLMNNTYTYDRVDNVLKVTNSAPLPTAAGAMGGQATHEYTYDGLYRLTAATGSYTGTGGKTAAYTLDMQYDNLHNITSKKQHLSQKDVQFDGILKAGYELAYHYNPEKPHQIQTLQDEDYRTEGETVNEADKAEKEHQYQYDANGNLVRIHTGTHRQDESLSQKTRQKQLLWDEENRLLSINDNGYVSNYWYDAGGERVVKTSGENENVHVNGLFSGGRTGEKFTAYVNPYLVVSPGGQYTKHIYIGTQRVVSKMGDLESFGQDPRRVAYAGQNVDGENGKVDYAGKYSAAYDSIQSRYENIFDMPFNGKRNSDPVNGHAFCCLDNSALRSGNIGKGNDDPELYQYYYHSDHLGSTSLITNLDGEIVQHVEYVPFGEVFIEERNNTWNTPYLFNAKELDEETGLYYYVARYYDPRTNTWLSADPLQEKYPGISTYAYCNNNPVKYVDPNGMEWEIDGINYEPGENCPEDASQSTKDKWSTMNEIYADKNGKTIIDEMNKEGILFKVSSETSNSDGSASYRSNGDGTGGTIFMNGKDKNVFLMSHEVFHGYQDMNGQSGRSIFNEVEAYMFSFSITDINVLNMYAGNTDQLYGNTLNNLLYSEFDAVDFDFIVENIKNCGLMNIRNDYASYPERRENQTQNLISRFYPLIKNNIPVP
jgi:RHS repeat-associated protein